jgi:muramidase (phage lysozyme)
MALTLHLNTQPPSQQTAKKSTWLQLKFSLCTSKITFCTHKGAIMALKQASQLKSKEYYASLLSNPYVQAALNTISKAEGTAKGTRNVQDPYSTIVGYTSFSDFNDHPRQYVRSQNSTAAGKYQVLDHVWDEVSKAVGIPDFSPTSQDIFAVARIDQRGGLEPLLKGDFSTFSDKVKKEWASFPGANYKGQGMRSAAQVEQWFNEYVAAAKNTPAFMNGLRQDPFAVKTIDGVRSLAKGLDQARIPTPLSREYSRFNNPQNVPMPTQAPAPMSATPTSDFRGLPAAPRSLPAVNPSAIQRMQDNLTSKMAFARPNPSNMNISGYGFSTPAKPSGPQATGSATGNINRASAVGNLAVPGRSPGVLGGRGNINPPNVVAAPANVLSNFDQYGNFIGNRQSSAAPTSDFRSTLADRANVPQSLPQAAAPSAPIQSMTDATRAAQAQTARQMAKDQFARDLIRSMPAPAPVQTEAAKLASQYSQYQRGTVPSAQINPSVYDMVDVPQSSTIASQYASYGAGKIAPQVASSATQAMPNVPQTVGPRAPSAPAVNAPMTQQQRMDKALADMRVGIPPKDIYKEQLGIPVAPANPVFGNGFRGFGAGGFLGNLLTGNLRSAAGIPGGFQLPGVLGIIQNAVQRLGGPQQAQQAVQTVAPALGQVMGLPAAQQAAKAGNNMVIGRDANGILGWMADGGLSAGAANAGWASNNPERNYGGYGGGYDPTPV